MSRIGRKPIPVPAGVTISIEPELVRVNGPKGELTERIQRDIAVEHDKNRKSPGNGVCQSQCDARGTTQRTLQQLPTAQTAVAEGDLIERAHHRSL